MYKIITRLILLLLIFPFGQVSAQPVDKDNVESEPESIDGAFGIHLGESFKPSMVASILSQDEHTYQGPESTKFQGTLYRVIPEKPDKRFQDYYIKTTNEGLIYAIEGDYHYEVEPAQGKKMGKVKHSREVRATCKNAVKNLARELEARYGKPRGKGWDGEWFSFRQFSKTSNKSIKLYANRCRTGLYSVIYKDESLQHGP